MLETRRELAIGRIGDILLEKSVSEPFRRYFERAASFIGSLENFRNNNARGMYKDSSMEELAAINYDFYKWQLPEYYEEDYSNPKVMCKMIEALGGDGKLGKSLSFLYAEIYALIPYAYENNLEILVLYYELFLEVYGLFEVAFQEGRVFPESEELRMIIYWFERDNCDIIVNERILDQIDPSRDFATRIIMDSDLTDLRYLYSFGEYITDSEVRTAEYLNSLPKEDIEAMANTYTEGYRVGFIKTGKDISKKKTVNIRYCLGFERMIRQAVINFRKMGMEPVIYRASCLALNKRKIRLGYFGAVPNRQYDFDHIEDEALFLDKDYINRRLDVIKSSYEANKTIAGELGGPAVVEVFGEEPFSPLNNEYAVKLSKNQQKLDTEYSDKSARITNEYIKGEERSYTIISYPNPKIGKDYEAVFNETVKLNTLDYVLYENMQQIIIDTLDKAEYVEVKGANGNETSLNIYLNKLSDPEHETNFENCVADVNIPVGEVFTTPRLKGTGGLLHIKQAFLEGYKYIDLRINIKDGVTKEYSCGNFPDKCFGEKYIKEHILFNHDFLPMGEFAIGTNTTAYVCARKYGIEDRLPILIGEKTGPHFAFGDTCYSYEEDLHTYNPDGKAIVARSNDFSDMRKVNSEKAYFHCHTDITIPYDELGVITAVSADGSRTDIIRDGLFVLEGLGELNKPLKNQ